MNRHELIDDYLANRMDGGQRAAFERQLEVEPDLRSELELQKEIVDSIRAARARELKARLQTIPIESGLSTVTTGYVFRMAATIAGIGVLAAATYYYIGNSPPVPADTLGTDITQQFPSLKRGDSPAVAPVPDPEVTPAVPTPQPADKVTVQVAPDRAQRPSLSVTDPTAELAGENAPQTPLPDAPARPAITTADVHVAVDRQNRKFGFHYQFTNGSLHLFGPFDKGLFEILEIPGEQRSLFLFYQAAYYPLAQDQSEITRLEAVTNPELLKLLRAYHRE